MTPIDPRRTRFANPRPTPLMIAVPHSGPMTRRPRARARRLSAASSANDMPSLKRKTCSPAESAWCASMAAYAPGTATTAMLAEAVRRAALAVVRDTTSSRAGSPSRLALKSSSTRASARCATVSVLARTQIRRSEGPASGASGGHIPASASIERPGAVPITTPTSVTPASCRACSATRMRSIESKYEFRRTVQASRITRGES